MAYKGPYGQPLSNIEGVEQEFELKQPSFTFVEFFKSFFIVAIRTLFHYYNSQPCLTVVHCLELSSMLHID